MVYISSWQDFQEAAEGLYEKSPTNVSTRILFLGQTEIILSTDEVLRKMEGLGGQTCSKDH